MWYISDKTNLSLTQKERIYYLLVSQSPWCLFSHRPKYERWCFSIPPYLFQPANSDCQICFSLVPECSSIVCMYEAHLCLELSRKWPFLERHCRCKWFKTLAPSCQCAHGKSALDCDAHCFCVCLHFYQDKHQAGLFSLFGVTSDVSHLCLINMGDGTMKFRSQAEQVQLRGAHMQTFIIEQQAFIIHRSGFPCSPQIKSLLFTHVNCCWNTDVDEYSVTRRLRWQEPCLFIYSPNK